MKQIVEEQFKEIFGTEGKFKTYFIPSKAKTEEDINQNPENDIETEGIYATAREREDGILNFYLVNDEEKGIITIPINNLSHNENDGWIKYPKELLEALIMNGYNIEHGFDIIYNIDKQENINESILLKKITFLIVKEMFKFEVELENLNKKDEEEEEVSNLEDINGTGEKLQIL